MPCGSACKPFIVNCHDANQKKDLKITRKKQAQRARIITDWTGNKETSGVLGSAAALKHAQVPRWNTLEN